jgi:uncharacterized membrane protein YhaH (DUF805 family)
MDAAERFSLKMREKTAQLQWLMFSFKGRIDRLVFLLAIFLLYGVPLLLYFLIGALAESGLVTIATPLTIKEFGESAASIAASFLAVGVFMWINLAVTFKRLHDFGRSLGTFLLLSLFGMIPFVGWFVGMIPFFASGDLYPNQYGSGSGWKNRPM